MMLQHLPLCRNKPVRRANEDGAALVLALIFLTVCGLAIGGLLSYMNTSSAATTAVRVSRDSDYDEVSVMNAAIASVRVGNPCGTGASAVTPTWTLNNAGRPLRVDCFPVTPPIFDSTTSPLPKSMPSIAYEARSTWENGDLVSFASTQRRLSTVTVTMEDWALHSTWTSWPAAAWDWPITLDIYKVDRSGANPAPGDLIATKTQTFSIPWRPEADATCSTSGYWKDASTGLCYSSVPANITYDLSSLNVDLPDEVIVGVAFNTAHYGQAPAGVDGPYNSLNIAVAPSTSVGTNVEPDALFFNSTFGGFYSDGGAGGTGTLRRSTGWGTYTPAIKVVATDIPSALKRTDVFSVCPTSVAAPCPDSQSLMHANVTFYDGQGTGSSVGVSTWSNN
jgi:hypothetical protein